MSAAAMAFNALDRNHDGSISRAEFAAAGMGGAPVQYGAQAVQYSAPPVQYGGYAGGVTYGAPAATTFQAAPAVSYAAPAASTYSAGRQRSNGSAIRPVLGLPLESVGRLEPRQ